MIYAFIFLGKLFEVAISTIRVVLTARGNRVVASLLGAVEIAIWIVVTSTVLLGISEDPLRAVAFGLAFAIGIYMGITIEDKLALGLSHIEIIAEFYLAKRIAREFREQGFGVTTYDCEGLEGRKLSVGIKIHRRDVPCAIELLRNYENLFVTITDIMKLSMGQIGRHSIMKR